ncbi:hypothetical protein NXC14_PA00233 (plasmid) [Rhizobium sp. NXC14]|nr:hypothetical protein NXC14_PA00233 [Rhizobium sp. NXC14]
MSERVQRAKCRSRCERVNFLKISVAAPQSAHDLDPHPAAPDRAAWMQERENLSGG